MIANCRGFSLEFVNPVLHILCPLCGRLAVIESLPWNRLADGDAEMLAHILVHLVHQEHHGKVERQMLVAESGDAIEPLGVLPTEMDRHHITLILHTLGDESLLPRQVADAAIRLLAAVQVPQGTSACGCRSGSQPLPCEGSHGSVGRSC